jgi:hypothetical protein
MKKYFAIAIMLIMPLVIFAQKQAAVLTEGTQLLFKNTKSKLTANEKNWLFKQINFSLSKDKKKLMSEGVEVEVQVYITDLNKEGMEEVFIVMKSTALFGNTGEAFTLFIKNSKGILELHDEIGAGIAMVLLSKKAGYPDIAIGGPGFKFPVYKWDGKKYKYLKEINDADLQSNKIKYRYLEDCSKLYTDTLQ